MSTDKWVQHFSGQGRKFEWEWEGPEAWICRNTGYNGMVLPKSEYIKCEPPEKWEETDITRKLVVKFNSGGYRENIVSSEGVEIGMIQMFDTELYRVKSLVMEKKID